MSTQHTERAFESPIEGHLLNSAGYSKGDPEAFDRTCCIDPTWVLEFIRDTQPADWAYLQNIQRERAERTLLEALCDALNSEYEGCLKVLRHGFKCFGKLFRMAYFAPASGLNPATQSLYAAKPDHPDTPTETIIPSTWS